MNPELIDKLIVSNDTKIVFLILDGVGGLPLPGGDKTELEAADTPNLDRLIKKSTCGLLDPIGYGITPGSGPAHLALFGYDPVKNNVGRGILSAAGVNFPMTEKDLFMRVNFATIDDSGLVIDRRAGRIDDETNKRLCRKLQENIRLKSHEVFFETEKEHRALIVLRGDNLREEIEETDPQKVGAPPISPEPLKPEAEETAAIIAELTEKTKDVLSDEEKANMILLRGYAKYRRYPGLNERFGLNPLAIANYPMYRGIARLLGMTVNTLTETIESEFAALRENYEKYDFFFLHIKPTDSRGEDGDFDAKVKVIEEVDSLLPVITELCPDVLVVTGDHSTPALLASHSWHPVPVLLSSDTCRPDNVERFGERECIHGGLGRMPMVYLMGIILAHAKRLAKFGA
ncbi:MAG: 2,3-bisphosphoglycerate-independent phosphoglycerate mutase [Thermodesulfobacteriota bacterium]|nr:2,3-bisphosphoglycerate-independent phosphoglycerate mutase [Thermodesulfobacteriota bacterium]